LQSDSLYRSASMINATMACCNFLQCWSACWSVLSVIWCTWLSWSLRKWLICDNDNCLLVVCGIISATVGTLSMLNNKLDSKYVSKFIFQYLFYPSYTLHISGSNRAKRPGYCLTRKNCIDKQILFRSSLIVRMVRNNVLMVSHELTLTLYALTPKATRTKRLWKLERRWLYFRLWCQVSLLGIF